MSRKREVYDKAPLHSKTRRLSNFANTEGQKTVIMWLGGRRQAPADDRLSECTPHGKYAW